MSALLEAAPALSQPLASTPQQSCSWNSEWSEQVPALVMDQGVIFDGNVTMTPRPAPGAVTPRPAPAAVPARRSAASTDAAAAEASASESPEAAAARTTSPGPSDIKPF